MRPQRMSRTMLMHQRAPEAEVPQTQVPGNALGEGLCRKVLKSGPNVLPRKFLKERAKSQPSLMVTKAEQRNTRLGWAQRF